MQANSSIRWYVPCAALALVGSTAFAADNVFTLGTGTVIHQVAPDSNYAALVGAGRVTANRLKVDSEDPAGSAAQALLKFNNLFANDAGPIALNSDVHFASLRLVTTNTGNGGAFHRMLQPWSPSNTWNSFGNNGLHADNVELVAPADMSTGGVGALSPRTFTVTNSLQAWSNGQSNQGWGILPLGTDGWEWTHFTSSTTASRPQLKVISSPQVPGAIDVSFRQGVNGYTGTVDTRLRGAAPDDTSFATNAELSIDGEDSGQPTQGLLRFGRIFNDEGGIVPRGATIVSAWMEIESTDQGHGADVHRMLTPWQDTDTWNTLGAGVQADGIEAVATRELRIDGTFYNASGHADSLTNGKVVIDVTASVAAWSGGADNNGWALLPFNTDGWRFSSSEGTAPPTLHIRYVPEPADAALLALGAIFAGRRRIRAAR